MIYCVDRIKRKRNCKNFCQRNLLQFVYFITLEQNFMGAPKAISGNHYVKNIDEI